ncbi:hypothetical protein D3C72_2040800 [compost metagenome]
MPGIAIQRGKCLAISRIGQLVDIDNAIGIIVAQPIEYEIRADKSGASCDQDVRQNFYSLKSIYFENPTNAEHSLLAREAGRGKI